MVSALFGHVFVSHFKSIMAKQKDEKQYLSRYKMAFEYLTLHFDFSKQNSTNQFNHFHWKKKMLTEGFKWITKPVMDD